MRLRLLSLGLGLETEKPVSQISDLSCQIIEITMKYKNYPCAKMDVKAINKFNEKVEY